MKFFPAFLSKDTTIELTFSLYNVLLYFSRNFYCEYKSNLGYLNVSFFVSINTFEAFEK